MADQDKTGANFVPTPPRDAPVNTVGMGAMIKKNLFAGPVSWVATPVLLFIIVSVLWHVFSWGLLRATNHGASNRTCHLAERTSLLSQHEITILMADKLLLSKSYQSQDQRQFWVDSQSTWGRFALGTLGFGPSYGELLTAEIMGNREVSRALSQRAEILATINKDIEFIERNPDPDATLHPGLANVVAGKDLLAGREALKAAVTAQDPVAFEAARSEFDDMVHWGEAHNGACWTVVKRRWQQFMYGFYPKEQVWRVATTALLLLLGGLSLLWPGRSSASRSLSAAVVGGLIGYTVSSGVGLASGGLLLALALSVGLALLYEQLDVGKRGLIFFLGFPLVAIWLLIRFSLPQAITLPSTWGQWVFGLIMMAIWALFFWQSWQRQTQSHSFKPITNLVYLAVGVLTFYVFLTVRVDVDGQQLSSFQELLGRLRLSDVEVDNVWGGLLATAVTGLTGIAVSLPLGVILALGRRSDLPIVSTFSTGFIEFVRGVPLITILFMASVLLPLFLPEGVTINKLFRALVGVSLFASAYMAEVIRGGLQGLSKGQTEGADSLGLSYWQTQRFIILPQALKISIPGIVNTFIGLYKDTTLLSIIGIFDLLGVGSRSVLPSLEWARLEAEVYAFIALFFFVSCFFMSRYSQHLERRLATGHEH